MANASHFLLQSAPLAQHVSSRVPQRHQSRGGHLRLVADGRLATPLVKVNRRLGAAICVGFCGLFWSAVATAAIWG